MPRGGRRPGAGARKGNTNALKNGAKSARLRQLSLALNFHPHRVHIYLVGLELGALPKRPADLDPAKAVRLLYPAVFDPDHPRYNDIANPTCTELEAARAARAFMNGKPPLNVFAPVHQRPSNTVKDIQTPEYTLLALPAPADSKQTETQENERPSNAQGGEHSFNEDPVAHRPRG